MARPRLKVPRSAQKDEIITIKTLISHKMESGQRKGRDGKVIPRQIINKFVCEFNGKVVFSCDLEPAVSNNPYLQFKVKVPESGKFTFKWFDDNGSVYQASKSIKVT